MSELADRAISGDQQSFHDYRKLTACGVALVLGGPAAAAAVAADKSVFQKSMEYAAGKAEETADSMVESLIDRQASHFAIILRKSLATAVDAGCRAAGCWIGHFFGPTGIKIGAKIGAAVGKFLNMNIATLVDKGIEKVKSVAKTVWQKGKAMLKKGFNKLKHLF